MVTERGDEVAKFVIFTYLFCCHAIKFFLIKIFSSFNFFVFVYYSWKL